MALPAILYAFMESGLQVKIVGAVVQSRKTIIAYDKEMFRDTPSLVVGGASGVDDNAGTTPMTAQIAGGVSPTVTFGGNTIEVVGASSVLQEDAFLHIRKRHIDKMDTVVQFWDAATIGVALAGLSVTTVLNSAIITVPNAELLTPGQGITGVGIPVGTTILAILSEAAGVITKTTAVMSQAATAAGTVSAVLTGSNLVGEFMQSEFVCWGSEITTPM